MSRNLPAQPNLEHLRNQAKDRLDDLRQREPDAKLADALHAVALEYGFATWPRLKEHVLAANAVVAQPHPFAGRWEADVSKSQRHPANQFRRARMHFAIEGEVITVRDIVVDAEGRSEEHVHRIQADGGEHVMPNGYVTVAQWANARTLDTIATKDGEVVGRGSYQISADGEILTITGEDQRIVCYRA